MGHKKFECRAAMQGGGSMRDGERKATQALQQQTKTNIQCYRCQEMGHIATHCPKGVSGGGKRFEKRVELCVVEDPKSQTMQRGEKFQITFDSGAECSLVKESMSSKLMGKRANNLITMKGIGNANIYSTVQILSEVVLNDNCLKILFHVVPDDSLKNNIVIGREVLAQGLSALVSCDGEGQNN